MAIKRPLPVYFTPSPTLPSKSPTVHKIHILGEDEKSKYIAHALSGVYDSVELLGWKNTQNRYRNIEKTWATRSRGTRTLERNNVQPFNKKVQDEDTSHIDNLVVTGQGCSAHLALEGIKHRIDKNSTVCLMNDGLGVLEDVRRRVFDGTDSVPKFVFGHMSHKLVFSREFDSVKELKSGQLLFTPPMLTTTSIIRGRANFVDELVERSGKIGDLRAASTTMDHWLSFKLPSVLFSSVVEPVCVALDLSYQGLVQNPAAQRMLYQLLEEIITVLDNMRELKDCPTVRNFLRGNSIHRLIHNGILGKSNAESQLALQVKRGDPTDVDYLSGYFLRQGQKLGVEMKLNLMMRDMVRAKHTISREWNNTAVPFEESSIPPEQTAQFRTRPMEVGEDLRKAEFKHRRFKGAWRGVRV